MLSFDANLAVHAANTASALHEPAFGFLDSLGKRKDVVICELMLVELYLVLRNVKIFPKPLSPRRAAAVCQGYRDNRSWMLVESAPVMDEVWAQAAGRQFAFRRIIDARLAFTLSHHGVSDFATINTKDFRDFAFDRVWNPLSK